MKLNIGCGFQKFPGYLNVDKENLCGPDLALDFEKLPWPWPNDHFDEVAAIHSLEHMGASPRDWIGIMKELWRVCAPNAVIRIAVPHPRHDNFLHDPTHVRVITPIGLAMFDQVRNLKGIETGGGETKLGLYAGIDFEVAEVHYDLDESWREKLHAGRVTNAQIDVALLENNNVCIQIRMVLRAIKPCRGAEWMERNRAGLG